MVAVVMGMDLLDVLKAGQSGLRLLEHQLDLRRQVSEVDSVVGNQSHAFVFYTDFLLIV